MAETDDVKTLESIRARHAAASRGPWKWFGYLSNHDVSLEGRGVTVMDFVRWGMSGAQPRWSVKGFLEKLADLVVPDTAAGRGRVTDINHPDARFIAASWQDTKDLLGMVDALQARVAEMESRADERREHLLNLQDAKRKAESERDALRAFAESFATTAEVAVAAHRAPKTGMQVPFHGDFAHVQPSVVGRLEWWARQARAAMAPRAEEPRSPQQHACPTGDVCPTCDEPEVPRG